MFLTPVVQVPGGPKQMDYHMSAYTAGSPCSFYINGGANLDTKKDRIEGSFYVQDTDCKDADLFFTMQKQ